MKRGGLSPTDSRERERKREWGNMKKIGFKEDTLKCKKELQKEN